MTLQNWSKISVIVLLTTFGGGLAMAQTPPEEFVKGLELISKNANEAKINFLVAQQKEPLFHGTYHFLGVIYLDENQLDSAIYCFKKVIALNTTNANKTKEMAYVRLVDAYLYNYNFENAFATAWEAFQRFPDNLTIKQNLQDVCLWAFYVNHNNLNINYISKDLESEYVVRSVSEEYLIIRRKLVDGAHLYVESQSSIKKEGLFYDVLSCTQVNGKKFDVTFKLDWDVTKNFSGRVTNTEDVYFNASNPIYERIGALLVFTSRINLQAEIDKLN
ncbi:MAG TPA: hypothetical protein VJ856_04120 [Paludibacteraceae bacterium]|nr:hypothetical protein [Paludibacteraceae bacterium]